MTNTQSFGRILRLLPLLLVVLVALCTDVTSAAGCAANTASVKTTGKSYKAYATSAVQLGKDEGWVSIPSGQAICVADLVRDFRVTSSGDTVPYWTTSDVKESVTRAVIVLAGKNRDAWSYFNLMRNARNKAAATYPNDVKRSQVVVYAPMIFTEADKAAGSVGATDVYWQGNDWASGRFAAGPSDAAEHLSTFDVLDQLIAEVKRQHPTVKDIVLAGHSMAAQALNRYSAMKTTSDGAVRISYWLGNPGSWLWMETARPVAIPAKCSDYDTYKYGLSDSIPAYAKKQYRSGGERTGALKRLLQKNVHIRVGANDYGPGDMRCQAMAQGANHKERGRNFRNSITALNGGKLPSNWTYQAVPGCTHNVECMFDGNLKTLFLGQSDAVPKAAQNKKTSKRDVEDGDEEQVAATLSDERDKMRHRRRRATPQH